MIEMNQRPLKVSTFLYASPYDYRKLLNILCPTRVMDLLQAQL